MPPLATALLLFFACYLIGALPFGYLVGRLKGIDLFKVGSGNIGATNAGRVLGRKFGLLVFAFDFLKGAIPVAVIDALGRSLGIDAESTLGHVDALRVGAALFAFLGHLYPVYLGFRGGKGVATAAGAFLVLVPGPALLGLLAWVVLLLASRTVSLASILGVSLVLVIHSLSVSSPFGSRDWLITTLCALGVLVVILKHRANLLRLIAGTENRIDDGELRHTLLRLFHLVAIGLWFGAAAFFNFGTATSIFDSFKKVVHDGPSDRTAYVQIIPDDAPQQQKDDLASALAGSAVGPIFPKYFLLQAVCGAIALVTAAVWHRTQPGRGWHRARTFVIGVAFTLVVVGWPISTVVSELRLERWSPDPVVAASARSAFVPWHLVSLALSGLTTCLVGVGLALGAKLPSPPESVILAGRPVAVPKGPDGRGTN